MLELGVCPEVAAATSATMIMFTAGSGAGAAGAGLYSDAAWAADDHESGESPRQEERDHLHDGHLDGGGFLCGGVPERAERDEGGGPRGGAVGLGQHLQPGVTCPEDVLTTSGMILLC